MDPAVVSYLQRVQPASLLECSDTPWSNLASLCQHAGIDYHCLTPEDIIASSTVADLAIVHDIPDTTTAAQQQLLGHMRNCLVKRIWLLLPEDADWPLQTLTALGFRADDGSLAAAGMRSYTYDIGSYNHKRSWNNARFWANPENFHRFRW